MNIELCPEQCLNCGQKQQGYLCRQYQWLVKLVKRDIPKKVITHITPKDLRIGHCVMGEGTKIHKCICGQFVNYGDKFCRECGQRLDWEDSKDV